MSSTLPVRPKPWSATARTIVSLLIAAHFSCVAIAYAANWQRSDFLDSVLSRLHPYLVTSGFYVEMLGVDWTTGKSSDALSSVEYQSGDSAGEWQELISNIGNEQQHRPRRLLRAINALVEFEDSDGTCVVLQSLIERAVKQGADIKRVRVVSAPDLEAGEKVVFEASVSKLENGRMVLLPRIDAYRTVPPVPATTPAVQPLPSSPAKSGVSQSKQHGVPSGGEVASSTSKSSELLRIGAGQGGRDE